MGVVNEDKLIKSDVKEGLLLLLGSFIFVSTLVTDMLGCTEKQLDEFVIYHRVALQGFDKPVTPQYANARWPS